MELISVSKERLKEILEILKQEEDEDSNLKRYNFSKDMEDLIDTDLKYLYTIENVPCLTYYPLNNFSSFTWVSKKYRGKGYGTALILGLTPSSYSFYLKLGFTLYCRGCKGKCKGDECDYIFKQDPQSGPVMLVK